MPGKKARRHAGAGQILVKDLRGERVPLSLSFDDLRVPRTPDISRKKERLKTLEYTGVLLARGFMNVEKGSYVVKRNVPFAGDLGGRYTKLHEELFGRTPSVSVRRGKDGKAVTIFSKLNHQYWTKVIGLNPDALEKEKLVSSTVLEHLLAKSNSDSRKAFLKGFFNARIGPAHREEAYLPFKFHVYHSNPRVLDLLAEVCAAEGIKLTGSGKMRRISESASILKTVKLLDDPYTLARIAAFVTENKRIGRERSEPEDLAKRFASADRTSIPKALADTGLVEKLSAAITERKFVKPKPSAIADGHKVVFEDQVKLLTSFISNKRKYNLERQLELLNSRPGLMDKMINYTSERHPKETQLIEILRKSRAESKNL